MSSTIEKNDVDLSKLFYYGDKFSIVDKQGKEITKVYIRLVGDSELNRARVFALRSSSELRSKLKDKNSDIHKAYIPDNYDDITKEDLVELINNYYMQSAAKEAVDAISLKLPVEPKSDAPLEEQEQYQKEVDEYPLKRIVVVKEKMNEILDKKREESSKKDKDSLIKEYESLFIASMCEQEMLTKFKEMCAYFGCFKDKAYKRPLFESFDEFDNTLSEVKQQIIDDYSSLELSSNELKK